MDWIGAAELLVVRIELAVIVYFLIVNGFYFVLLTSSFIELREQILTTRYEPTWPVLGSAIAPDLSLLAPAFNEEATIVSSVEALLSLSYPALEVVVVNDGSTDSTLEVLEAHFDLVPIHPVVHRRLDSAPVRGIYRSRTSPGLTVVDKEGGGKSDALNAGLNITAGELVCAIDADTLIERDALQRMVRPFLQSEEVIAAGGTIRVANGCTVRAGRVVSVGAPSNPLAAIQVVEYLRGFLFGRLGWNRLGGNLIISGAFGLYRRDALLAVGGYSADTVSEDMELVVRLRRRGYETGQPSKVTFVPDPVAWTEVPETLRGLGRQRDRWHRGLGGVLWRHRAVCLNPRYGAMGLIVYPYFLLLEFVAPIVEVLGLLAIALGISAGILDLSVAVLFFLVAYGLGTALSLLTLGIEAMSFHRYERFRDVAALVGWALVENFGYRQMNVIWRMRGIVNLLRGRTDWGVIRRAGFHAGPVLDEQKPLQ